jgi:hypothetical protein
MLSRHEILGESGIIMIKLKYFFIIIWICWLVKPAVAEQYELRYGLVHIVTIRNSGIKQVKDLKGRKLSIREGNIDDTISMKILKELNLECGKNVTCHYDKGVDQPFKLKNHEIDAVAIVL